MDDQVIHVLMVAPLLPPEYAGGGKQAIALGKKLQLKNVRVIGLGGTSIKGESPVYKRKTEGIETYRVYRAENTGFIGNWFYLARFAITLFLLARKVDILHFHGIRLYPMIGIPIAKILGKRTIGKISLMDKDDPVTLSQGLLGKIKIAILKNLDIWIALTAEARETCLLIGIPDEKIKQVTNGVDCKIFRPISSRKQKEIRKQLGLDDGIIIVFAGIVSYRKGVDLLIEAIPKTLESYDDARFVLIGPNQKEHNQLVNPELTERLRSLDADRVTLGGFVDSPLPYIRSADIFILPSRKEGLSNAFLEALGTGIATVITDHPWLSDVGVAGEDFLTFSSGSSEELSDQILTLLKDDDLRDSLSENASERVRKGLCLEQIAQKYQGVYKSILS